MITYYMSVWHSLAFFKWQKIVNCDISFQILFGVGVSMEPRLVGFTAWLLNEVSNHYLAWINARSKGTPAYNQEHDCLSMGQRPCTDSVLNLNGVENVSGISAQPSSSIIEAQPSNTAAACAHTSHSSLREHTAICVTEWQGFSTCIILESFLCIRHTNSQALWTITTYMLLFSDSLWQPPSIISEVKIC